MAYGIKRKRDNGAITKEKADTLLYVYQKVAKSSVEFSQYEVDILNQIKEEHQIYRRTIACRALIRAHDLGAINTRMFSSVRMTIAISKEDLAIFDGIKEKYGIKTKSAVIRALLRAYNLSNRRYD